MQEKLADLWQSIEANLRIVVFVIMGLLLVAVMIIRYTESDQAYVPQMAPRGPAGGGIQSAEDLENDPHLMKLQEVAQRRDSSIQDYDYSNLLTSSMFDVKDVQDAMAREERANRRFNDALTLYNQRQYRQALGVINEVLTIRSNHLRALEMKADLEERLRETGVVGR